MTEGTIRFHVMHTPAHWDDPMTSVTLSVIVNQVGGRGAVLIHTDVSPAQAREYAAEIMAACERVEGKMSG